MKKFTFVIIAILTTFILTSCPGVGPDSTSDPTPNTTTYTITFNKNDTDAIGSMVDQTIASGSFVNLSTCGFTKTGWTFTGWSTTADGGIEYTDEASYIMGASNITLYAKWIHSSLVLLDKQDMVSVPSGTFIQKGPFAFPQSSFSHTISSFQLAKYEVTYELWYTVHNWALSNGYVFANPGREGNDGTLLGFTIGADPTSAKYEPVTTIDWRDAIVWCNAYSEMAGYSLVYENESGEILKGSFGTACDGAVPNWNNNGYRLPTEGEWQYAASYIDGSNWLGYDHASGDVSSYCSPSNGSTSTVFGDYAWYSSNSGNTTHDVGTKTANHLGIHDMSGNVWEWCWDWCGDYPTGSETDYTGVESGSHRIIRGGSSLNGANPLQVCYCSPRSPVGYYDDLGLRVLRTP